MKNVYTLFTITSMAISSSAFAATMQFERKKEMAFKSLQYLCAVLLTIASVNVYAIPSNIVNNGTYTSDLDTGLDWLDLSLSDGLSYNDAGAMFPEWRYATNSEVENLFSLTFSGFYSTLNDPLNPPTGLSRTEDGAYANQNIDVQNFTDLFGITGTFINGFNTYGLYIDEDNLLKITGASYNVFSSGEIRTVVYGPEYSGNEFQDRNVGYATAGTYLVRSTTVPEPSILALMFTGLIALGIARRKKS